MKNVGMLLTTSSRKLLYYVFSTDHMHELFRFENASRLMGIAKERRNLYVADHTAIYHLGLDTVKVNKIYEASVQKFFHHMKIKNKKLFIASTATNDIMIYDTETKDIKEVRIEGGQYIKSYEGDLCIVNNHINGIFIQDDLYYVTLNKAKYGVTGLSSILVMDSNFKVVNIFPYGWQSHGFCIIDGIKYGLCAYWKEQGDLSHPKYSGLMVDGKIEYIFEEGEFLKDISADSNYIYVVGGNTANREDRKHSSGILYKFDYTLKPVGKLVIQGCGDINGCLLDMYDLTN